MPRKSRFYLPDMPAHVIQRGNDKDAVFFDSNDYRVYKRWLKEASERHGCAIHAYVLMTNHIHILLTPSRKDSISHLFQDVGRHYVPYINREYGRSGTLWEGRHKGSLVSTEDYFLTCSRYIELNPVRAGMARSPNQYRWSSYRANALGQADDLITPHPIYQALGKDTGTRRQAYRGLFRHHIDPEQLHDIRAAAQTGTPLGNDRFRQQIERRLKCKVGQARRGRPFKAQNNNV